MVNKKIVVVAPFILCACAGIGQKPPDVTLDGGIPKPKEQVIRLALGSSATFPGHPMNTHFSVNIKSVNGKPINGNVLQLSPGKYEVEYRCYKKFGTNDTGGAESVGTYKVDLSSKDIGSTYYPWVDGVRDGIKESGGGYYTSYGRCWISQFTTVNPWLPQYSR